MAPTILDILHENELRLADVDSPRLSAELLAAEVLGCSRLDLVIDRTRVLSSNEIEKIRRLVSRRADGEPLAYIVGHKEFYGLEFRVTSDVLIPRPETEHIIEEVETLFVHDAPFRFADLGTGSGILAVTLAHLFPQALGVAVDASSSALGVAKSNAEKHAVMDRLDFLEGDFTQPLFEETSFDLIVSNPPYVTTQEYAEASHEVTGYEPVSALVSGDDGLDHIRAMMPHVLSALKSGGRFLMEFGFRQGRQIEKIIIDEFPEFKDVSIKKDLAGHDRIALLQKK
ncbi:peptide chain release factor N(5)-glutamine methyltransferase [Pseudodesulfovibrio sp.]|nr:peptide chain release factor N(5)-glutamine methyltransferase [Pseudodesulfovibrio sp.]